MCMTCERDRQLIKHTKKVYSDMSDDDIKRNIINAYRVYSIKLRIAREILKERCNHV